MTRNYLQRSPLHPNDTELHPPSGCAWCTLPRRIHGWKLGPLAGTHPWAPPTQQQILARMRARRKERAAIARENAEEN